MNCAGMLDLVVFCCTRITLEIHPAKQKQDKKGGKTSDKLRNSNNQSWKFTTFTEKLWPLHKTVKVI